LSHISLVLPPCEGLGVSLYEKMQMAWSSPTCTW